MFLLVCVTHDTACVAIDRGMFEYVHPLRYRMSSCVTILGSCVQHLIINFSAFAAFKMPEYPTWAHGETGAYVSLIGVEERVYLATHRKERIVGRKDAEGMPDPPASRLRNACCSSLHITTFQSSSHFRVLLPLLYCFWRT
jgi:hypothetical protein